MTHLLRLPAVIVLALALPGCTVEGSTCRPSRTRARPAEKVDLRAVSRSATVEATLTGEGDPLSARSLTFEVLDDGATVYEADATTNASGVARVDLKRADPAALVALARADEFRATFAGDGEWCRSSDDAPFSAVRS